VRIEECAPISKLKTWTVVDRIGTAKAAAIEISEPEALNPDAAPPAPPPVEEKAEKPAKKPTTKKAKAKDVADADA